MTRLNHHSLFFSFFFFAIQFAEATHTNRTESLSWVSEKSKRKVWKYSHLIGLSGFKYHV